MILLLRLVLFVLVALGLAYVIKALRAPRLAAGSKPKRLIAEAAPELREARALTEEVYELLGRHAGTEVAERANESVTQLEDIVLKLEDVLDVRRRISDALASRDPVTLQTEVEASERRVREAIDEESRAAAEAAFERQKAHQAQVKRLQSRKQVLDSTAAHIVLELKNLQLTLLDALSSKAALEVEDLERASKQIGEVRDELGRRALAEREIASMLGEH